MTGFDQWIGFILDDEGAELNIGGSEPGGASRYGVSVTALSDAFKAQGAPPATIDDIRNLTRDNAIAFYRWYFAPMRLDELSPGVAYRLADIETNLGPTGGVWALGLALGAYPLPDKMTDGLIAQAKGMDAKQLIAALSAAFLARKHESPGWAHYDHGWINRRNKAHARAMAMEPA